MFAIDSNMSRGVGKNAGIHDQIRALIESEISSKEFRWKPAYQKNTASGKYAGGLELT